MKNNREYKFRVWNTWDKVWERQIAHKKVLIDMDGIVFIGNIGISYSDSSDITPDRFIIQQYTGLKDKNGKEIYEGDIVSIIDDNNVFQVKFGKVKRNIVGFDTDTIYPVELNTFYFEQENRPYFSITENFLGKNDLEDTFILGNIFENKELLQ